MRRVGVALCDTARRVINILPELRKHRFLAPRRRSWQRQLVEVGEHAPFFLASARQPFKKTFLLEGIKAPYDRGAVKMRLTGERLNRREALAGPVVGEVRKERQHLLFGGRGALYVVIDPMGVFEAHLASSRTVSSPWRPSSPFRSGVSSPS